MRELMLDQQRSAEVVRSRQRAQQLQSDLPAIIEDRVGEHVDRLENRLLEDFREMGKKAIEESTSVLNEQFDERIKTLEQISSIQSRTITNLRDSSKIAERKVSSVVNSIESTLSTAVPGFQLEASRYPTPLIEPGSEMVSAEPAEVEELRGNSGFCPKCTSTNIRRAYRSGMWDEFLRLFFIAPFRCRACRHKFYRF